MENDQGHTQPISQQPAAAYADTESFVFTCPHCGQSLEAVSALIGQSLDCPTCNAPLVVPSNTLRHSPQSDRSRQKKATWLIGSGVAAALVVSIGFILSKGPPDNRHKGSTGQISTATSGGISTNSVKELLSNYLAADTAEKRSKFCVDGDKILKVMEDYYKSTITSTELKEVGSEKFKGNLGDAKLYSVEVKVSSKDLLGNNITNDIVYYYLQYKNRLSLDWMASSGGNVVSLSALKRLDQAPTEPLRMRFSAKLDDYYNYEYQNSKDFALSISLTEPLTNRRVHSYVARESDLGKKLRDVLNYESNKSLTLLVRNNRASESKDFLFIEDLVRDDWGPEISEEKALRQNLVEARSEFNEFVKNQKTIDDILEETNPKPTLLPLRMIYKRYSGQLAGVDFAGRRITIEASNEVSKSLEKHIAGSQFQEEVFLLAMKSDPGDDKSLTILDLLYTGPHIEDDSEKNSREARQAELASSLKEVFGDERDKLIDDYGSKHVRDQLLKVKRGERSQYDSTLDILSALLVSMKKQKFPETQAEQKDWIKTALGTPDDSDMDSFNDGNYLSWDYWRILKNQDTEKYSEDVKFAFPPGRVMIFISGPSGRGSVGGGIRHPAGIETRTYADLKEVLKSNIQFFKN